MTTDADPTPGPPIGHPIVSHDDWLLARGELLAAEKQLMQQRDEVTRLRQQLPWVEVDADYRFDTGDGEAGLLDLFGGHSQLIVQHFMFGADWDEGCPSCSFWADSFEGNLGHLAARDAALVLVSTAPVDVLHAYRDRMGWTLPWVSSAGSTFNRDFGVTGSEHYNFASTPEPIDEAPGISAFVRVGDRVLRTYSTYARGLDPFNSVYQLLDIVPKGRDESDLPWTMAWLRRHDQYE
jgi:predicted dithiol-disulfide oxidoreductase (DUF899 family)